MWQVHFRGSHPGKWTTGTCSGCLCKPKVLTANDSYPYSPHPDWWWQKGRYSSACVSQLLGLLLSQTLRLDKEMKPNNATDKWQQRAWKAETPKAPSLWSPYFVLSLRLLSSPSLRVPVVFSRTELWFFHSLWPSASILKNSMMVYHQLKNK